MIRGRSTRKYRYHVLLDHQNQHLCDWAKGHRTVKYTGEQYYETFFTDDDWTEVLDRPGVRYFVTDGRPGGGNALLATNHPLWVPRTGAPLIWDDVVRALGLAQE